MKSGVSTACLYPELLEDAVFDLASRGVERAEIFINSHCETEPDFVKKMKSITDGYGIQIDSLHPYTCGIEPMMFFTDYERRFRDIVDYYKRYFEIMNVFGAKYFVFHGNKPQNQFPRERYFERFAGLSRAGKEFGITVAQENVARCVSGKLDFLKEMSDYLGDEAAFVLDMKQALRAGENSFEMLEALGKKVVHVHFSDSREGADCLCFGKGTFNCDKFFSELKALKFDGTIMLELYRSGFSDCDRLVESYRDLKNAADRY